MAEEDGTNKGWYTTADAERSGCNIDSDGSGILCLVYRTSKESGAISGALTEPEVWQLAICVVSSHQILFLVKGRLKKMKICQWVVSSSL